MHDPRVGRFFATDPLEKKYPHNSPYAFSENRVIDSQELEGLELRMCTQSLEFRGHYDPDYLHPTNSSQILEAQMSGTAFKMAFKNYLPKKFIDIYTGMDGGTLHLSHQETINLNASSVSIMHGYEKQYMEKEKANFNKEFNSLKRGQSKHINLSVLSKANNKGTLGHFTIVFDGVLKRGDGVSWVFTGTMKFTDEWNFDTKKKGERTESSEINTEIGKKYLIGKPFKIESPTYDVKETDSDPSIDWFIGKDESIIELSTFGKKAPEYYKSIKNVID